MLFSLSLLLTFGAFQTAVHGASYITRSSLWPTNPGATMENGVYKVPKVVIPYVIPLDYNGPEYLLFENAIRTISTTTKDCIKFISAPTSLSTDLLRVTPYTDPTAENPLMSPVCRGPLGYTGSIQNLILVGGANTNPSLGPAGCLQNPRDIPRMLMNALGVVNEFQRPDRDAPGSPMTFGDGYNAKVLDALQGEGVFDKKNPSETLVAFPEYDTDSITMVAPTRYAKVASVPVYGLEDGFEVPTGNGLSQGDCNVLNYMYRCGIDCQSSAGSGAPAFDQKEISQSYFCWPTAGGAVGAGVDPIGTVTATNAAPINPAADISLYQLTPSSPYVQVDPQPGAPNTARLRLKTQIKTGFQAAGLLTGKTGSVTRAESELQINVNCWPRFRLAAGDEFCGTPGETGTVDSSATVSTIDRQCLRSGTYTAKVQCDASGKISPFRSIINIASISDPDGTNPEFIGLLASVSGTPVPAGSFVYVQVTNTIMATTAGLDPETYRFGLIFADGASTIEFTFDATIECQ